MCARLCVCVCVCERERERERASWVSKWEALLRLIPTETSLNNITDDNIARGLPHLYSRSCCVEMKPEYQISLHFDYNANYLMKNQIYQD